MHSPGPVDVALDGAVGRGRDRSRGRRQQDGVGAVGRFDGPEDRRLLVAHAPVPRRDEGALPHPGLGFARGLFVGIVIMGKPRVGQRPPVLHQPFLDVLAVDFAPRHLPATTVRDLARVTGPALVLGMLDQLVARGDAAGPALALGVEAELVHRGRVDPPKADSGVADLDMVALADFWNPGNVGGLPDRRQQQQQKHKQKFHEHVKATVFQCRIASAEARIVVRIWPPYQPRHGARFQLNAMKARFTLRTESSSPAKAGDPVFQSARDKPQSRGVLDTPHFAGYDTALLSTRPLHHGPARQR